MALNIKFSAMGKHRKISPSPLAGDDLALPAVIKSALGVTSGDLIDLGVWDLEV